MSRPLAVAFACAVLALFAPRAALAHAVGISTGEYTASGASVTADVTLARPELLSAIPRLDADGDGALTDAELARGSGTLSDVVVRGIAVRGDGAACAGALDSATLTEQDGVRVRAHYTCPAPVSALDVELPLLDALSHGHRHVATARVGEASQEDLLYRGHDTISVGATPSGSGSQPARGASRPGFLGFLALGVEHILTGYDHLVFLFGLILVGGRVRALVGVITAFTVAHSITLALAALDVWSPPSRLVEAAIALSIVYVGVENFFVTNAEGRWRITFPFGLVHGFGFASALREVSLSRAEIPVALVSFNLGVEAGQLLVMAVLLPAVLFLRKKKWLERRETQVLSALVAGLGAVWFVLRVLG
jgi:hypothetical protein